MSKVIVVGIGPGEYEQMTVKAVNALNSCDTIVGYTVYVDLVREHFAGKEMLTTPMRKETQRCEMAFEEAAKGKTVAMICSGDAGVYGMSGLIYEVGEKYPGVEVEVVSGVTAALSGGAVLGAPLMHDFAVISLSDLMTPWEKIEKRLAAAGEADFSIPPAKSGPTISGRPVTSCCATAHRRRSAAPCPTSAGRGRREQSIPWPSFGTPRWICSPPCLSAIPRPRSSAARW